MENQKQQLTDAAKIAQFRLSVIAPVIHGLYPDASRNAYYRRVTEKPLTLPDGSTFQYNPKTISKRVSPYQTGGGDAPVPKRRSGKKTPPGGPGGRGGGSPRGRCAPSQGGAP